MTATRLTCIVDDSADYRLVLQRIFSRSLPDYPVRFFPGGNEFLDELPQMSQQPGLIILDRHMPGLDGHQTLVHLKQHPVNKFIPVVMMSGEATSVEILGCYESGANLFLKKKLDLVSIEKTMLDLCHYWLDT